MLVVNKFDSGQFKNQAKDKKIVAVGEIGLDYFWLDRADPNFSNLINTQKKGFIEQLILAKTFNLPVILHEVLDG